MITHGFSNTTWQLGALPADLAPFGFGGCRLEVSPELSVLLVINSGAANQTLQLPNDPGLTNVQFWSQVLVLDALAPNGNGALSNGAHTVMGQ